MEAINEIAHKLIRDEGFPDNPTNQAAAEHLVSRALCDHHLNRSPYTVRRLQAREGVTAHTLQSAVALFRAYFATPLSAMYAGRLRAEVIRLTQRLALPNLIWQEALLRVPSDRGRAAVS